MHHRSQLLLTLISSAVKGIYAAPSLLELYPHCCLGNGKGTNVMLNSEIFVINKYHFISLIIVLAPLLRFIFCECGQVFYHSHHNETKREKRLRLETRISSIVRCNPGRFSQ